MSDIELMELNLKISDLDNAIEENQERWNWEEQEFWRWIQSDEGLYHSYEFAKGNPSARREVLEDMLAAVERVTDRRLRADLDIVEEFTDLTAELEEAEAERTELLEGENDD